MEIRFYRNRYFLSLATSVLLIVGPVLFGLLLQIPSLVYTNDCDNAGRCEHNIVEIANSLGLGLIFLGPVLMLLGVVMLVVTGFAWGMRAFKRKISDHPRIKYIRRLIGLACFGILLFLLYVPSGPDQCSRVLTDTQYEICLEGVFSDMTTAEARQWLAENDFRVGRVVNSNPRYSRARDTRHADDPTFSYDFHFQAFRDFGKFRSVPYGTNFNRFFARIGPAPDRFELNIYGSVEDDRVVAVDVWWAFSFL
ncbi:hypothetical protein [Notoacmeibacter sp. MSK16QG-6]|uniref:hypothetical protein n=1 Tax=Notoacmeibacter sp. MSK16QG-6 TaxID=2957982 RepID=UPI00209E8A24|nr:hypothetical protein [Notoacmeibacter sp. MSK16QG-6]MCP1201134.1 hypothetical protein [Notoacmeibacter sp. MSK16QG-6]